MISDINILCYILLKDTQNKGKFCIRTIKEEKYIIHIYQGYMVREYKISTQLYSTIYQKIDKVTGYPDMNIKLSDIQSILLTNRNNKLTRVI